MMHLRIPNPHNSSEDFQFYERVYGGLQYQGKTVLDVGADVGSTADYFLQKGAACVYAIEGDQRLFNRLCQNIQLVLGDPSFQTVKPWKIFLGDAETIAGVLYQARADIVKFDLDGLPRQFYEDLLAELPPHVLKMSGEWLIELHTRENARKVSQAFLTAGFLKLRDNLWAPPNTSVAYFRLP
jgi:predicted methyltransferase